MVSREGLMPGVDPQVPGEDAMGPLELSLNRLASAWEGGSSRCLAARGASHPKVRAPAPRVAHPPLLDSVDVVLASRVGHPNPWTMQPIPSAAAFDRTYRLRSVTVDDLGALERLCDDATPRVLVVDADLVAAADDALLHRLRHRLGEPEWLLAWDTASAAHQHEATRSLCHGGIEWGAPADRLAAALDAVLAGELWFPRIFLEHLYLSLVDAGAGRSDAAEPPCSGLTAREDEVLKCMRRGLTNKQIASQLHISVNTVKKHLAQAFRKSGLRSRRQLRE